MQFTKEEKREKQITVNDLYSIVVYLKLKCVIMLKHVTCMYLCIFASQELKMVYVFRLTFKSFVNRKYDIS